LEVEQREEETRGKSIASKNVNVPLATLTPVGACGLICFAQEVSQLMRRRIFHIIIALPRRAQQSKSSFDS
jgi:hypothetical protein